MTSEANYKNGRLTISRTFDAPQTAVFDAWIKTSKVQLWWGCNVATEVKSTIEPRLGGQFSHQMTLNEGVLYQNHGRITAYDPPNLLAYEMLDQFHNAPMQVRVEFVAEGNKTHVHLTQDNLPDTYNEFIMAGWTAGFAKLAELLNEKHEG